jgi:hypothetical protein
MPRQHNRVARIRKKITAVLRASTRTDARNAMCERACYALWSLGIRAARRTG